LADRKHPPPRDADELAKTIARLAHEHSAHRDSFVMSPRETIEDRRGARSPRAAAAQKSAAPLAEPRSGLGLELGATLGEGGMGVVRQARQLALERDVAVKTIQPKLASDLATKMLLQEALILGRLEHPNILPIYDVRHEAGEPHIVLKKIEGIEWSSVINRPEVIRDDLGADDALAWNLNILMQVCNAVHFAHSRDIIHRDLKPDNVMIGEFGEVYVMDWGLAVSLDDDGSGRFPLASDATQLAGTPQYMAPEMLGGGERLISARTDVYLLGAILYEIIAGHAPHRGSELAVMIGQVIVSRPPLPESCPTELARICRMAMDPDPGWRFESAEQVRTALQGFLQHAGSRRLADQAGARADELLALIAGKATDVAERIDDLFVECRFAYRQALELWPENEEAGRGLERVVQAMNEYELAQQQRIAELELLSKQLDIETGGRGRAIGAGILGIVWTIAPVLSPLAWSQIPTTNRLPVIAFLTAVLIAIGVWAYLAHQNLKESSKTRWLMRGAAVAMVGTLVLELAGSLLHIAPMHIESMWPLVWFCVSAMLTVQVDWRMLPMTLAFLGTLIVAALSPESRFYAMGASNLVMTINMFSIWMPWRSVRKS